MKTKSRAQHIRDDADIYRRSHGGGQIPAKDIAQWLMDTGRWERKKTDLQECTEEVVAALRTAVDSDGDRWWLSGTDDQQQTFWVHRTDASWDMRRAFVEANARRIKADKTKHLRLVRKLNDERKRGEPEFQTYLDFGDDASDEFS
jgi:hypothetical protein